MSFEQRYLSRFIYYVVLFTKLLQNPSKVGFEKGCTDNMVVCCYRFLCPSENRGLLIIHVESQVIKTQNSQNYQLNLVTFWLGILGLHLSYFPRVCSRFIKKPRKNRSLCPSSLDVKIQRLIPLRQDENGRLVKSRRQLSSESRRKNNKKMQFFVTITWY